MRLVSTVILTRILVPQDFALIGLATSLIFVMEMISDAGFRGYILKHKRLFEDRALDNLWTLQLIRGFGLYVIALLLAYPISLFFAIDGLFTSLIILSHILLIKNAASLAPFIADRMNKPAKPFLIQFIGNIIGSLLTIITTIIFESKWCVILGVSYPIIIVSICSYLFFPDSRHRLYLNKAQFLEFMQWSKFTVPSSLLTLVISQSDKVVFGKILSEEVLGMYFIALNLTVTAETFVINFARRIIGPVLANKIHSENQDATHPLTEAFYRAKNRLILLISAGLGAACGFSPLIIQIIYDDRYTMVGMFLSLLLIRPALQLLSYPFESILMVQGNAKTTLQANLVRATWLLCALYPMYLQFGWIGAVYTYVSMEFFAVIYFLITAQRRALLRLGNELSYIATFVISLLLCREVEPAVTAFISHYLPI